MSLSMAQVNSSQITDADLESLQESKLSEGKALVYSTPDPTFGFFALISEEQELRQSDYKKFSPEMQRAVEWAHQQGASYLFLSPDCEAADFDASPGNTSSPYDEVREAVT